jgi:hypothetical protein
MVIARGRLPGETGRGGDNILEALGNFLTGRPLGTGRTPLVEFFKVKERPPFNFNSSDSGLYP